MGKAEFNASTTTAGGTALALALCALVTLAEARESHAGGDPLAAKRKPPEPTFAEATEEVIDRRKANYKAGSNSANN